MAVNAKFQADFTSFYDAVQKAEVLLRGFAGQSAVVEKQLSAMVDRFSGRRVVQEATLMTEAITRIGGASKLTADEQTRVNKVITDAIDKFKAFGKEAPKAMQDLADATKRVEPPTTLLSTQLGKLAGIFTLGAVAKWGADLIQAASHLQDVSERTGISAEALQRFDVIAQQSGTTIDAVSMAIFQMGKRLAGGDQSAAAAAQELGLSFDDLRNSSPETAFNTIGLAIAQLPDPMKQSELGAKLFGRSVQELIPVFQHLKDQTGPFVKLTNEQVAALDAAGDAWVRVKASIIPATFALIDNKLKLSEAITEWQAFLGIVPLVSDVTGRAVKELQAYNKAIEDRGKAPVLNDTEMLRAEQEMAAEQQKQIQIVKDQKKAAEEYQTALRNVLDATAGYDRLLRTVSGDTIEAVRYGLQHKNAIGDLAKVYGLTEQQIELIQRAMEDEKDAIDAVTRSIEESERTGAEGAAAVAKGLQGMRAELMNLAIATGGTIIAGKQFDEQVLGLMPDLSDEAARHLDGLRQSTVQWGNELDGLAKAFVDLAQVADGELSDIARQIGIVLNAMKAGRDAGYAISSNYQDLRVNGFTSSSAIGLAGGAVGAYGAIDTATSSGSTGSRVASGALTGAAIGSVVPGIGTAVGAGVGALVGWIKGMKAAREELEKNRATVAQFETQLHGLLTNSQKMEAGNVNWKETVIAVRDAYIATGRSEQEAEAAVKKLWDSSAKGAQATADAIAEINGVFQEQALDQQNLQAAIEKYHFSIEELGPAMQKQKLTEQAVGLLNDFRLLAGSGIDLGVVIDHMSDSINEYLHLALRTGQEVPSEMKPIIEKMIEMGKLTDENGNAITDLDSSGIKFSETMTQGFDRIIKKFDELINKIADTTGALNRIPTDKTVTVHYNDETSGGPSGNQDRGGRDSSQAALGGYVTRTGIEYLAGGGRVLPFISRGTDTVPAMLTPGEGVLSTSGMKALGTLNHGGMLGSGITHAEFQALRTATEKTSAEIIELRRYMQRSFAKDQARAMRDEFQKSRSFAS